MANNLAKEKARKILIQNKLYALTHCDDLKRIIESRQFTIIEYKKHSNTDPVSELIKMLRIEKETRQNDSFVYINNNLKFVFVNADVSLEDKCALLRHELGHICDDDFKNRNPQNSKIKREEFANEFSCYIKNPGIIFQFYLFVIKNWKRFIGVIALIICVFGVFFMIKGLIMQQTKPVTSTRSTSERSDDACYVTSAGKKYHRKHCIIIKYKNNLTEIKLNDAVNAGYTPCLICHPEECAN